jgi:hypothetical protein
MKNLLKFKFKKIVRVAYFRIYRSDENVIYIEKNSGIFISVKKRNNFILGYCQFWLFAMRNFPELTNILPLKSPGRFKFKNI